MAKATPGNNRPLSPHLQIYGWQITWTLSILHRIAGIALGVGTLMLAYWLIALATGPEAYQNAMAFIGSIFGMVPLFGFTAALIYHLLNGIRHLVWDAGYGFDLGTVSASGWAILILTAVLTVFVWAIGLGLVGGSA